MGIEHKYFNYSVGTITFEAYCAYQSSNQKQREPSARLCAIYIYLTYYPIIVIL